MCKEFIYSVRALVLQQSEGASQKMLTEPLIIVTSSFMMQSKKIN